MLFKLKFLLKNKTLVNELYSIIASSSDRVCYKSNDAEWG